MRVLVTGGSGFLGSHIVDACLAQGDDVVAVARPSSDVGHLAGLPRVEIRRGELGDPAFLDGAMAGVEVVHHAAARVLDYGSRAQFYDTNVRATEALVAAARRAGTRRFVFISSPSVVADGTHQVNIDETYPVPARFLNLYSETKAAAEALVLASNTPDLVTCALRPRAVWGPRDRHGFMPKLVARLRAGKLRDLSGGEPVVASMCYVENAAQACLLAATAPDAGGRAYFITDREVIEVWPFMNRLAEMFEVPPVRGRVSPGKLRVIVAIAEALWKFPPLGRNVAPPVSRYAVSLLTRSGTYDISAARRDLGYQPTIAQDEGFARLRAWVTSIGGVAEFVRLAH